MLLLFVESLVARLSLLHRENASIQLITWVGFGWIGRQGICQESNLAPSWSPSRILQLSGWHYYRYTEPWISIVGYNNIIRPRQKCLLLFVYPFCWPGLLRSVQDPILQNVRRLVIQIHLLKYNNRFISTKNIDNFS